MSLESGIGLRVKRFGMSDFESKLAISKTVYNLAYNS